MNRQWLTAVLILFCCLEKIVHACDIELVVLGTAQDAGAPQIGVANDPAWNNPKLVRLATSLAVIDRTSQQRYLFDATPDIKTQLYHLDNRHPAVSRDVFQGVFLTHAHIGHYAGLMFFGREAMGASGIPVYVMPRMHSFLSENGPWSQLVELNNISLKQITEKTPVKLSKRLTVTPWRVPHRDEFSETVGFEIETLQQSVLFLPDLDSWDEWETEFGQSIEVWIRKMDLLFIDASFYDDNEIPGRDMSRIPHPRIAHMMERFEPLATSDKKKIQFIHLNHTNPVRYIDSKEHQAVVSQGFSVAVEQDTHCLLD